jgi:hypothetical protein
MTLLVDGLLTIAAGAGLLAIVAGLATLEDAHRGPFVKVPHLDLPWPVRKQAYVYYSIAAACWLPLLLVWLDARQGR